MIGTYGILQHHHFGTITTGYVTSGTWCKIVWHQKWWYCRTPYLQIVEVVDTVCVGPCTTLWVGVLQVLCSKPCWNGREGLFELEVRGVEQDYTICGATGNSKSSWWGMDYWPLCPSLLGGAGKGTWLLPTMEKPPNLVWWPEVLVWY